jgi:hypothetical protein
MLDAVKLLFILTGASTYLGKKAELFSASIKMPLHDSSFSHVSKTKFDFLSPSARSGGDDGALVVLLRGDGDPIMDSVTFTGKQSVCSRNPEAKFPLSICLLVAAASLSPSRITVRTGLCNFVFLSYRTFFHLLFLFCLCLWDADAVIEVDIFMVAQLS